MSSRQTQFISGAILRNPAGLKRGDTVRTVVESLNERRVVLGLVVDVGDDRINVRFEEPIKVTGYIASYQEGHAPVDTKEPAPPGVARKPLPSAHQIGDKVKAFGGTATVVAVHFGDIKVHYDIAWTDYQDSVTRDVDSADVEDA